MTAAYTPIAADLPAVYREDADSFAQLDSFLGLVDELHRAYLDRLGELGAWLSPAGSAWPPGLGLTAGGDAVLARYEELYDELASWFGYAFPGSWPTEAVGVASRRDLLLRVARLWRRRGTPRGLLDWFCSYFGLTEEAQRPELVEHFAYADPATGEADGCDAGLRATLLVPAGPPFRDRARRGEARQFVDRFAPSHVLVRVCWVRPGSRLPRPDRPNDPATWEDHRAEVRRRLRSVVDHTEHAGAMHLDECRSDRPVEDRLGTGRLPSADADPDSPGG
jgi:hypothetical protein